MAMYTRTHRCDCIHGQLLQNSTLPHTHTHTHTHTDTNRVMRSFLTHHRVHAEYQLNDEPNRQFWFTPAQYTGRLIIDKEAQHVEFFELYVPTNKQLNIGVCVCACVHACMHIWLCDDYMHHLQTWSGSQGRVLMK